MSSMEDIPPVPPDCILDTIKPRRIPSQNIVHRLIERETRGFKSALNTNKNFYLHVFPNFTIANVDIPLCFIRKFSPDGKLLLVFTTDQTSIQIYKYMGPSAAADLIKDCDDEVVDDDNGRDIVNKAFQRFFRLRHVVNLCQNGEQLNRECSLFSDDSRYVIVGSSVPMTEDSRPNFHNIYTNNESVVPNHKSPLEDYCLYLVDLRTGRHCDTIQFKVDKIFLGNNQGIYLYRETLAILSVQHQTIHIYKIEDGQFIEVRKIGRFCFEDDELVLAPILSQSSATQRSFREASINGLKHRILVFLYHRACVLSEQTGSPLELRRFYQYFDQFRALRLWKMQLIDDRLLLLKYASESIVTMKVPEPSSQSLIFAIYDFIDAKVITVFENTSEEFLRVFENFCYLFRNVKRYNQFGCCPSNSINSRQQVQRFKQTITRAQFGGATEATRRLLNMLPFSAHSYTSSPYLDLDLFSYDEKRVSMFERPKNCGESPIRFYGRESGFLKFRLHAHGSMGRGFQLANRKLVAFTFHPTDPFAISVQKSTFEYVVNFHVRHDAASLGF